MSGNHPANCLQHLKQALALPETPTKKCSPAKNHTRRMGTPRVPFGASCRRLVNHFHESLIEDAPPNGPGPPGRVASIRKMGDEFLP
jgi:hypothetical protein